MKIAKDTVVSIHYTLKSPDGAVIDSSEGEGPLLFLFGHGALVPGMENALLDKTVGDEFSVVIPSEEGYGNRDEGLLQEIPKTELEGIDDVEAGMFLEVDTEVGPMVVVVTEVGDTAVTLDGNHPLAGQELHFDVKIEEVRAATKEEIEHEHAHGEGGHHH